MNQSRDFVSIRGQGVRHSTAVRDWCCGMCGSRLVTMCGFAGWVTLCANDPDHSPDEFVHQSTWAAREHRALMEAETAQEVFNNLPPELQAAIISEKETEKCPSKD